MVTFQGCKVINKNLQIELQSDVFLWNPEKTRKLFYIINNIFGPPVWLRALWLPLCPFFDGHGLPPGGSDTGLLAGHKERKAGVTLDSLGRAFNSPAWETSVDKPARLIIILCWFQMPRQWTKCECMWLCTAMTKILQIECVKLISQHPQLGVDTGVYGRWNEWVFDLSAAMTHTGAGGIWERCNCRLLILFHLPIFHLSNNILSNMGFNFWFPASQ